ncbi:MAG TPA: hypothetical protein VN845_07365 [Solirubrobacteraceae bacterium]|nr:hypothetical protein [Solirubrobacteraceae bacterium]
MNVAVRQLAWTATLCLCLLATCAVPAIATQVPARLSASFDPLRLGKRTTLEFGFSFSAPAGQVPPPLTGIELHYPENLGIELSGLGLADCTVAAMEAGGPGGCPPNAVMGFGEVLSGVVLGTQIVSETAQVTVMRAPDREGHLAVLFYAEGTVPVDARIIFPGLLLPSSSPFGGVVNIGVPLVETLPGAPYVSVIALHSTIGPKKVVYYEQLDGHTLAYRPRGILLPQRCPRLGFPFSAKFSFSDGSVASAHTVIPCPESLGAKRRARPGRG